MFSKNLSKLEALEPLIDAVNDEEITALAKFLYERITHPDSYLVFLGEFSSGKSSIINGLLKETVLPVSSAPTTAAITEVELTSDIEEDEYYAINKNATFEKISHALFVELCENPDSKLKRLKLRRKSDDKRLSNLRIFDTPGYESIVSEHEEVLKDFLPNSDIVIYTVNYKIGIQEADYGFLGFLRELIRDDVQIILLINLCPEGISEDNPKIREIKSYVKDILAVEPETFLVERQLPAEGQIAALPVCNPLWNYVGSALNSEKRIQTLSNAFDLYIKELYLKCDSIIQTRYCESKMTVEELNSILELEKETAEKIRNAVSELVIPTFDKLRSVISEKIETVGENVISKVNSEIESTETAKMDEMVAFTNAHLLPHTIKKESDEIKEYIDVVLSDLNEKIDDYISKEVIEFNTQISIRLNSNTDVAVKNAGSKVLQKLGTNGLGHYFSIFGGAGGANAGIANAASHILKKIGDIFGKKFSRETHNALKHFLSKIGATSMKAVGSVVTVVVEVLMLVHDYSTWKGKLTKKVKEGVESWKNETTPLILEDLKKLEEENIKTINAIAKEIEESFEDNPSTDIEKCLNDVKLSEEIVKKINL